MDFHYPALTVNLPAIRQNAQFICDKLGAYGIQVAGVIKFSDADRKVAEAYGPCAQLAVSRCVHLRPLKEAFPEKKTLLTRAPGLREMDEAARFGDYILLSEKITLRALSDAALQAGTRPGVILMLDVGDRREGAVSIPDLVDLALFAEKECPGVECKGVGTNVACLNGVLPDYENLSFLAEGAEAVEQAIGRPLEIVSGGSTINMRLMTEGNGMPAKINHLRIGGFIANPMNMRINRGIAFSGMREDTHLLQAEIIELKEKDSAVSGATMNWAGQKIVTEDKGVRLRAIVEVGSQDIGDASNLIPVEEGVQIIGSSSDHTILDVTDCPQPLQVGDVLSFRMRYAALLYAYTGKHISRIYQE